MQSSIRTFLIINLLLSVTLITSLAIIGNLFLEHRNMEKRLDAQLTLMALRIEAFVSDDIKKRDLLRVQKMIQLIPERKNRIYLAQYQNDLSNKGYGDIQFQVWNNDTLLLRSHDAPVQSFSDGKPGFSRIKLTNIHWRVFSTTIPDTGIKVYVAASYEYQERLESRITQDSILIMLITYPFLALLIWIIVGRGFESIRKIRRELRQRDPKFLEPVASTNIPVEIEPFIDELNKLLARLRDALEREKRFAADAAHELKTPLAALKAHAQVAKQAEDKAEQQSALEKLILDADRSTHIVEQLLTLSRLAPEETLQKQVLMDLNHLSAEVIAQLVPSALKKQTDIELVAPDTPIMLNGNSTAISIMIRNLVDNAIRYTPNGSLVTVILEQSDSCITLTVRDNGTGIPENLKSRVFERFFRILGSRSPGSGLGLGIVQQIATAHQADIDLSTPPDGKGLEVTVRFHQNVHA